jgi:hypothetical protein
MAPSRTARIGFAALLLALPAHAAQEPLERLNAAFAAGRYEEALEVARTLEDPALAAEWSSYLYGVAGDLPGALHAARAGLTRAPQHVGLLTQALNASLTLGLAEGATELAERLRLASAGADADQIARADELAGLARDLAGRDVLAARSVARARALVLAGLGVLLVALLALSRETR